MSAPRDRRPDLDALRVFACYLLFLFHVGMVFNPSPFFHVRNGETSAFFFIVCGFIGIWHMPLFFALAGWSAAASLQTRGVAEFVAERVRKLAVPLVVACVTFLPVIKYLELRSGQDLRHTGYAASEEIRAQLRSLLPVEIPLAEPFDESFLAFLPTFFTDLDRFTWSHLWFVAYLLAFTLVLLPVLAAWSRRGPGPAAVSRAWVYAPMIPLAVIQLVLRERFPGPYNLYSDWANVSYFIVFLLAGFAMRVVPAFERALQAEWRRTFAVGTATTLAMLAMVLGAFESKHVALVGSAVSAWCFVVALLGFARERVVETRPRFGSLVESAFPVYFLHQPVVVVLGAAIVALPLGIAAKFVLLLGASITVTLGLYRSIVRPTAILRLALGMKPFRRRTHGGMRAAASKDAVRVGGAGALLALIAVVEPASAADPTGLWWAERGAAQVEIAPCDGSLCGRVTWLRNPFDESGCSLRDVENPDPQHRDRTILGMQLLRIEPSASDPTREWNGEIYDPTSGRAYDAYVQMEDPDRLHVRGYLGVRLLGRTTTWTRVGSEGQCRSDA